MSLLRRRMLNNGGAVVPPEYQQVKYITFPSTGVAFFGSVITRIGSYRKGGIVDLSCEMETDILTASTNFSPFGSYNDNDAFNNSCCVYINNSGYWNARVIGYLNNYAFGNDWGLATTGKQTISISLHTTISTSTNTNQCSISVNNASAIRTGPYAAGVLYFAIGNRMEGRSGGQLTYPSHHSMYHAKLDYVITNNTTNVDEHRDFYPCIRKSDNVIGIYDIINGVFYTKTGSGVITAGPNI